MKLGIQSLAILLICQFLLAALLIFSQQFNSASDDKRLSFDTLKDTSEFSITDDSSEVKLVFKDKRWLVSNENDFPAEPAKVSKFLESMEALSSQSSAIVALTKTARSRFKVNDTGFSKRITLADSRGVREDIYLGSSPGLDRVHVRKSDQNAIYLVKFPSYEASASTAAWIDKSVLQIRSTAIVSLKIGETLLEKQTTIYRFCKC